MSVPYLPPESDPELPGCKLAEAVRAILRSRGIECSESFLAGLPDELAGRIVTGKRDFRARIRTC